MTQQNIESTLQRDLKESNSLQKKTCFWWCFIKWFVIPLLTLVTIWIIYSFIYYPWVRFGNVMFRADNKLSDITTTLLDIPGKEHSFKESIDWYKVTDLKPIAKEEWKNIECKYPRNVPEAAKPADIRKLASRTRCIAPLFSSYRASDNKMPVECKGFFDCRGETIMMHEYVLEHPKILQNLIKVAEKPCHYIKPMQDRPTQLEGEDDDSFIKRIDEYQEIEEIRQLLHCDNAKDFPAWPFQKDHTYNVIRIIDSDGKAIMFITVPRKDTIHLIGKETGITDNILIVVKLIIQFVREELFTKVKK